MNKVRANKDTFNFQNSNYPTVEYRQDKNSFAKKSSISYIITSPFDNRHHVYIPHKDKEKKQKNKRIENQVSSETARQILSEAEYNGVPVDIYLKSFVEQNSENGKNSLPKVRRKAVRVDLSKSRKWLKENRRKYLGQWIVLDGDKLIGAGENPQPFVEKARADGVKIPFVKYIEDNTEPFTGGWL